MDSKSLSHAQIETIKSSVRARGGYFKRLADRMVANGFAADDVALKVTRDALEKIQVVVAHRAAQSSLGEGVPADQKFVKA